MNCDVAFRFQILDHLSLDVFITENSQAHLSCRRVAILVLGGERGFTTLLDDFLASLVNGSHLVGIVVVIGQSMIDIRDIEVVAVGDRSWFQTPSFDTVVDVENADTSAPNSGFTPNTSSTTMRSISTVSSCDRIKIVTPPNR